VARTICVRASTSQRWRSGPPTNILHSGGIKSGSRASGVVAVQHQGRPWRAYGTTPVISRDMLHGDVAESIATSAVILTIGRHMIVTSPTRRGVPESFLGIARRACRKSAAQRRGGRRVTC